MPNGRVNEFEDESPEINIQIAKDSAQILVGRTGIGCRWMYVLFEDYPAVDGAQFFGYMASRMRGKLISKSMIEGADK